MPRAAILSDTHLRDGRPLPPGCAELARGCDLVIHAGDFSDAVAVAAVRALGPPLAAVHGNVDSTEVQRLLGEEETVELGGRAISIVHDAGPAKGRLVRLRRRFPDADAVVFGHSHMPLLETEDGFAIFNPGSPTQRRRAPRHTMGLLEADDVKLRFRHIDLD